MFAVFALSVLSPATALAASSAACSGPDLAGKTLSSNEVSNLTSLRCANLTDTNLSGLSLGQVDFTDADLRGANLQNTDLTQATLSGADFAGADLAGATLNQATAQHTDFHGANLTGASLVQTNLTGANLDDTKLGGANFSQATFDGTTLTGATGLTPWSLYLLIAALLVLAVSAWAVLVQARRSGDRGASLVIRLVGCLLLAFGFRLFAGGVVDQVIAQTTAAANGACVGEPCAVGVDSGFLGLVSGIVVMVAAAWLLGRSRRIASVRIAGKR